MNLVKSLIKVSIPCLAACIALPTYGSIATFDENVLPTNPENGAGSFTFGDYSVAGAVTVTSSGIILDVVDSDGSNGVFGGIGVDYLQRDFDPADVDIELRLKILENNEATQIKILYRDRDDPGTADQFQFTFDISSLTTAGGFVTLTQNLLAPGPTYFQAASGYAAGDGIQNPGFDQFQVQAGYGSVGRLNVEIDYVKLVPEPSSLLVGSLVSLGVLARRKVR